MGEGWLSVVPPWIESGCEMNKHEQRLRAEIRFLDALVRWGETSTDVIPDDITHKYPDGGKWVGQIPNEYLREGIIVELKTIRSVRRSRHKGKIGLFGSADETAVTGQLSRLRLQLESLTSAKTNAGESAATESPAV